MPLESAITRRIVAALQQRKWWVMKIHGGPYQMAGVPDLLCIRRGVTRWLEVKQPGKRPTPLQTRRMLEIEREAGTLCHVVCSMDEALTALGDT